MARATGVRLAKYMDVETLTPSILRHLFKNKGVGPELNDEIINGGHTADASKLTEARVIALSEDASGSVEFDGTQDVTIETTVHKATQLRDTRDFSITGAVTASAIGFNGTGDVALNTTLSAISDSTSSSSSTTAASSAAVKSVSDSLSSLTTRVATLESSSGDMTPNWSSVSTWSDSKHDYEVNTTYTASTNGYLFVIFGWSHHGTLVVNGTEYAGRNGDDEYTHVFVPLKKGDKWMWSANSGYEVRWLPVG